MLIHLSASRRRERHWFHFAWFPVRTVCGHLAWLEVVIVERGYGVGIGFWSRYYLANRPQCDNDIARAAIAKAAGSVS